MEKIMTEKEAADLARLQALFGTSDHQTAFDEYREAEYPPAPSFVELKAALDEANGNLLTLGHALSEKREPIDQHIQRLEEQFKADNAELIDLVDRAKSIAAKAELTLRQAILDEHDRTGNKQIDKDLRLSVRVNRKISIRDAGAALAWSKVNAPMLVREVIDEKAFAKIIETLPELPEFVEEVKTPVAVIGKV